MTDTSPSFDGVAAIRNALPAGARGWTYYPLGFGILGFVVAFIVATIPPSHSSTTAGEIVNFPAMFGQYLLALLVALLSSVLLIIGALSGLLRPNR